MASRELDLGAHVPAGWISVDPDVVNEDAASMVLLRQADLEKPFTTNITVSERAIDTADDLSALAATYRAGLKGQANNLAVVREGPISRSPSRQYAQDLQFTADLNGQAVDIKQSQFLLELPTEEPSIALLLQVLYSAPIDVYDIAKTAVVEFMASVHAEIAGPAGSNTARTPRDANPSPAVSKEQLEMRVKQLLEQTAGQQADALVCNDGMRAEVGAVQRCALTVGQDKLGVTVTVVDVDGGHVEFDIQVDDRPML